MSTPRPPAKLRSRAGQKALLPRGLRAAWACIGKSLSCYLCFKQTLKAFLPLKNPLGLGC